MKTYDVFVQQEGGLHFLGKVTAAGTPAALQAAKRKFPYVLHPVLEQRT